MNLNYVSVYFNIIYITVFAGKIEKTDWNVKEIEKKMHENRMGRGLSGKTEKVPKWSKQQFNDKVDIVPLIFVFYFVVKLGLWLPRQFKIEPELSKTKIPYYFGFLCP